MTDGPTLFPIEDQVLAMLAEARGVPPSSLQPSARLLEDLGMDGDDAVEFFEAFGARFSVDLSSLYDHWPRHFGPEGWGLPDIRLNWLVGLGAVVIVAGLAGFAMVWSVLVGGGVILAAVLAGWWMRRTAAPHVAVTVGDLIAAADAGRWLVSYSAG